MPSPATSGASVGAGWVPSGRAASLWNEKLAFAGIGILFILHALYLQVVVDDAFISFQFARHLNQGYGLVWNIGDAPVEGYSNFLWVMLLALTDRLGIDYAAAGLAFGLAAGLGTLAYTFAFARRWFAPGTRWGWFVLGWLAAAGPLASWSSARLETPLFTLFIIGSLYHLGSFVRRGALSDVALTCLQILLASLTRPEGIGIAALVLGIATMAWPESTVGAEEIELRHRLTRFWIVFSLLVTLPFVLYMLWRMAYFHSLLPNTFHAKTGGGLHHVGRGVRYVIYFARDYLLPFVPLAAVLAVLKMRLPGRTLAEKDPLGAALSGRKAFQLEVLIMGGVTVVFTSYLVIVGGDYMPMYRFLVPMLPGIVLLGTAFLAALDRGAGPSRSRRWAIGGAVFLGLALTFHHSTPLERDRFGRPAVLEGTYRGIEFQRWNTARLTQIGRFLHDYQRSPDESVATRAVGALAYFSGLRVIDVLGIVDPHIARVQYQEGLIFHELPGHAKRDWPYVLSRKPTFLVMRNRLLPEPNVLEKLIGDMRPPEREQVEREYRVVSQWMDDPVTGESGYFSFLERKDRGEDP